MCFVVFAALLVGLCSFGSAQPIFLDDPFGAPTPPPAVQNHAENEPDFPDSAVVKTDPELERLLDRAKQFAVSGRYDLASVLWQRVLDESGDNLISGPADVVRWSDRPYRIYRPVATKVERMIASLPPDGRKAYRISADGEAQALLAADTAARQEEVMAEVARRYFLSSHGDDAAYRRACLALDRYDFVTASSLLTRLVTSHPDVSIPPEEVLLRLVVANARLGDTKSAQQILARLERLPRPPRRALVELARIELARARVDSSSPVDTGSQWHLSLGNPSRNACMPSLSSETTSAGLAELWSFDFGSLETKSLLEPTGLATHAAPGGGILIEGSYSFTSSVVMMHADPFGGPLKSVASKPAILVDRWRKSKWHAAGSMLFDNGRLYFSTGKNLLCVDAETGTLLWRSAWGYEYQPDAATRMRLSWGTQGQQGKPRSVQEAMFFGDRVHRSMSLSDGMIFCLEGKRAGHEPDGAEDESLAGSSRSVHSWSRQTPRRTRQNWLAAYDAATGKTLWRRDAHDTEATTAYEIGFLAAPVPSGRFLLVPVSDSGSVWLHGLSRTDGATVWKTFLCDEPVGGASPWSPVGICVDGQDAYVATGCGLIFAVDAMSGHVRWAVRYRRSGKTPVSTQHHYGYMPMMRMLDLDGFDEDVLIAHGRRLLVMASDCDQLFALDRRTGEFLWNSPRQPLDQSSPARYCLGVLDDGLYVAGSNVVRCYGLRSGALKWETPLDDSLGRGALTEGAIFVPVKDSVVQLDPQSGRAVQQAGVATLENRPLGNVYCDGERLMAVGFDRVYALTNLNGRLAELGQGVAAGDPDAYRARLRLLARIGRLDDAVADLQDLTTLLLKTPDRDETREVLYDALDELRLSRNRPLATADLLLRVEKGLPSGQPEGTPADSTWLPERRRLVRGVLQTFADQRTRAAAAVVLQMAPLLDESSLHMAAEKAIARTAESADTEAFYTALTDPDWRRRNLAVVATAAADRVGAPERLKPLLTDEHAAVRLAAVRALANAGDRSILPLLGKLLGADEVEVRIAASRLLRGLTGQRFGYTPYESSEKRQKATDAWMAWIAEHGADAPLTTPIREAPPPVGRTLIAYHGSNKVVEFDARRKQVWTAEVQQPWCVQGLSNGHRIVTSYVQRKVVEFDDAGKIVWHKDDLPGNPASAYRLDNGNTLIALSNRQLVIEIDYEGKTVWEATVDSSPMDAQRLDNGHTLVTLQSTGDIVELDRKGDQVWSATVPGAFSASQLPNGNTLVASTARGRVVEIDRDGEQVWEKTGLNIPYDAQRLPNGHTLIATQAKIVEVDPLGKVIWEQRARGGLRVHSY